MQTEEGEEGEKAKPERKTTKVRSAAWRGGTPGQLSALAAQTVTKEVHEWTLVNAKQPIWTRNAADVTEQEYKDFYKHISKDWQDPAAHEHFKVASSLCLCSAGAHRKRPPQGGGRRELQGAFSFGVQRIVTLARSLALHAGHRVHPQQAGARLLAGRQRERRPEAVREARVHHRQLEEHPAQGEQRPADAAAAPLLAHNTLSQYLGFLRGVIDAEDVDLNVSREVLQQVKEDALLLRVLRAQRSMLLVAAQSKTLSVIKTKVVRKTIAMIQKIASNETEWAAFWKNYNKVWPCFRVAPTDAARAGAQVRSAGGQREQGASEVRARDGARGPDADAAVLPSKLLQFESSTGNSTTLQGYVDRFVPGQEEVAPRR